MVERGRAIDVLSPTASAEEAAAIVAAVERFVRETAPRGSADDRSIRDPWWSAGILEDVHAPQGDLREPWINP